MTDNIAVLEGYTEEIVLDGEDSMLFLLVKPGCLCCTLEEWERIRIAQSNLREFPDDCNFESERRKRAFEFVKTEAIAKRDQLFGRDNG